MRKLMWFSLGFGAATAVAVYLHPGNRMLLIGGICLALGIACFALRKDSFRRCAFIMLGCALAAVWMIGYDALYLQTAQNRDSQTLELEITVADYSYETASGVGADGRVELDGKSYHVRFYLKEKTELAPGDVVKGRFYLRYTAFAGEDNENYHQGKGIFLLAYARDEASVFKTEDKAFRFFPARLRRQIKKVVDRVFPVDTLGFSQALLLGDSSKLSYEEDTAYRISGIHHVIAVSGLHVAILFSVIQALVGKKRLITLILGVPTLLLFAALAGFTPSIIRACVMQMLMVIAMLLDKEYDPPTALAVAGLLILLVNPFGITSVSFQLSVGCMAGILLFSKRIHDYLMQKGRMGDGKGKTFKAKLIRWTVASVSVSLSSMVFTVPLCGIYFGCVSLVGVFTNFLLLWMISHIFYGVSLAVVLGAIWTPAGTAIAWVISWPIRIIRWVTGALASIPAAAVYTENVYAVLWLVFCYVLFAYMLLAPKRKPAQVCVIMVLGLVLTWFLSWQEPRTGDGRMMALDVGQGQCIVLQSKDVIYVVDCGGDTPEIAADTAAQTLLSYGISHIDGLILTHFDGDHVGGAEYFMDRISVDCVYMPAMNDTHGYRMRITEKAGKNYRVVNESLTISDERYSLQIIPAISPISENDSSLCILFQAGNCDILITGDRDTQGESELMSQIRLPELEVLVAGHHGSGSSTGLELLQTTTPETVVISVGEDNLYGHPDDMMLYRLNLYGCKVLRTDQNGTIVIRW